MEEVADSAGVSVDTVRYYQSRRLLPPPRRQGRVALYGDEHVRRLARIRSLQSRGLTLAVIERVLAGELDEADTALVAALFSDPDHPGVRPVLFGIGELARRTGIPEALLAALSREGILVASRVGDEDGYTEADVEIAKAGLTLLDRGLPLAELLDLARSYHETVREIAKRAVDLFDEHVREPLQRSRSSVEAASTTEAGHFASGEAGHLATAGTGGNAARSLVEAYRELLPAATSLVAHHFSRVLVSTALEHIERLAPVGGSKS